MNADVVTDSDTTKIDDVAATVELTRTVSIGVGHHRCDKCRAWTPRPDAEVIRRFAIARAGAGFIWPFSDWWPCGWMQITEDKDQLTLCDRCAAVVRKGLEALKGLAGGTP